MRRLWQALVALALFGTDAPFWMTGATCALDRSETDVEDDMCADAMHSLLQTQTQMQSTRELAAASEAESLPDAAGGNWTRRSQVQPAALAAVSESESLLDAAGGNQTRRSQVQTAALAAVSDAESLLDAAGGNRTRRSQFQPAPSDARRVEAILAPSFEVVQSAGAAVDSVDGSQMILFIPALLAIGLILGVACVLNSGDPEWQNKEAEFYDAAQCGVPYSVANGHAHWGSQWVSKTFARRESYSSVVSLPPSYSTHPEAAADAHPSMDAGPSTPSICALPGQGFEEGLHEGSSPRERHVLALREQRLRLEANLSVAMRNDTMM